MDVKKRFRQAQEFAEVNGFAAGFPNFQEESSEVFFFHGINLLSSDVAEWRNVTVSELGDPPTDNVAAIFRAVHDYAVNNGFDAGFPDLREENVETDPVMGVILLLPGTIQLRDISESELGALPTDHIADRFRAASTFALNNGFAAGLPNFHRENDGAESRCGIVLFGSDVVELRNVLAGAPPVLSNFSFAPGVTPAQRDTLLQQHSAALSHASECGQLNPAEKAALIEAYNKPIHHHGITTPGVNAQTTVGGSTIGVNFAVLFPKGDVEIAQTLIHEMMHCAGFNHPQKLSVDQPFDGGPYFSSPPLRAEICIAGNQNALPRFEEKQNTDECREVNGVFSIISNKQ